jgi:hypothetical protein
MFFAREAGPCGSQGSGLGRQGRSVHPRRQRHAILDNPAVDTMQWGRRARLIGQGGVEAIGAGFSGLRYTTDGCAAGLCATTPVRP